MTLSRIPLLCLAGVVFVLFTGMPTADGQLHWPSPRKEAIEVRLIALAVAYPRSSFFSNDEVFIAEQQLAKEESRFIKLVYERDALELEVRDGVPDIGSGSQTGQIALLPHYIGRLRESSAPAHQRDSVLGADPPQTIDSPTIERGRTKRLAERSPCT